VSRPPSPVPIRANEFARQWQDVREDALEAVDRVGSSGWLVLGEEVLAFERELAQFWGIAHAVGVASGLDALEIGLRCAGVQPGTRVLSTPLTAFATTLAIVRAGAQPVWCDVDASGSIDLDLADDVLRADRSIRAMVPVHLYGHPLDPADLARLTAEHELTIVEDCAQSVGAERDGRATGLVGVAAATSLYPTKNLGAMGDGGVLLSDSAELAERARRLRDYGQGARYEHVELGLNSRLDELQAAILRSALLPRLGGWLERRREIAERYSEALADCSLRPVLPGGGRSAHHLFPVEVTEGDPAAVAERLAGYGVAIGRHYPHLCPEQPAIAGTGIVGGPLTVAKRLAERELSLPIHPYLQDEEVDRVIAACLEICE
jgi:dTDP-3-amino-3,4,6-trideoxy-alpha-D-glucose transaminase